MSDFFSNGWSLFVAIGTIAGLVFCLVLLGVAARHRVMANDNSTGHVWDEDLREMNNPLPRWWAILFVLTVIFAGIYLAMYPGLGTHKGSLGWSSAGAYDKEQAEAREAMGAVYAKFNGKPADQLAQNPEAMAIGERLFANNCAGCHGSDGKGSKGFPNLTDNDWLYGGNHDTIVQTITNGRNGIMPPMAAAVGSAADVRNVANYVLSLSGSAHNAIAAQLGKEKFGACAACHGADGKGNQALGAPNLTDKIWLHGWGEDAVIAMINNGKNNLMPAQASRLSPEQINVLGAYVWSLSNSSAVAAK
ncbi:cytochrome-c oxidase, cbb3-type subunit III [Paucibacter sp. KCTC 42545]|uniref:cytochrome-c oxidase, cbb3-type subunit III n=1 Tax=Paucibacter sp. KCTC 42545 TaxID=1768242 RepID=UPI000733AEC3|nr:cytochrome-c oxidase, cbb3-type subunit III [Paucibacter sp. KCTC 42545]ALT77695.1 cytochrome oxidase subunit III [Paucibacter sp. KCTC 42545]